MHFRELLVRGIYSPFFNKSINIMWELMSFFTGVLCGWAVVQGLKN